MHDERAEDQDPAPLEHADAERASEASEDVPTGEIEDDPAADPPDGPLKDIKGG
jgi:hypothetical protein